jgi:hypothetical protein
MAGRKQKTELRDELKDAGVVYAYPRPIGAFVYLGQRLELATVPVRKALQAAKDPNCKVLEYKAPKSGSTTKGSK